MFGLRTVFLPAIALTCCVCMVDSPRRTALAAAPPTNARAESGRVIVVLGGCKMEVELPKEPAAGSHVRVRTRLTNAGKQPMLVTWETNKPLPFDLELKTSTGKQVPLTRYGVKKIAPTDRFDQMSAHLGGSIRQCVLSPGETKELNLPNLALFYDLTVPGEYDLAVSKYVTVGKGPAAKDVRLRVKGIRLTISNP